MTELDAYFAAGLTSGWTSGLLSGYAPSTITSDSAGVLRAKAYALDARSNTGRITIVYCATSEIHIAIWEEAIEASDSGGIYRILLKGDRKDES